MRFQLTRISALILTGLIAGTFFYGTFCVLPAFYDLPSTLHLGFRVALMNHNKIVVMALVLLAIVALISYCWEARQLKTVRSLCFNALVMTIISLVITRLGSVPINLQIKTWQPSSPPADWLTVLKRWDLYNSIRTAASIIAFLSLLAADLWGKNLYENRKEDSPLISV